MTGPAGSAGRLFLIGLAASIVSVALFAWLADSVADNDVIALDASIRDFVHRHATPRLTVVMRVASAIGAPAVLTALSAAAVAVLLRRRRRRAAFLFLITMIGGLLIDAALKLGFHRTRPVSFFGTPLPDSYSFPSGHALISVCFFGSLAALATVRMRSRAMRVSIRLAAAAIALAIGLSRIYLGVHYPSDVIAGFAAAVIWVTAAAYAYRAWLRRPAGSGCAGPVA
jgi:membrane-associated phospholipid phosphatase